MPRHACPRRSRPPLARPIEMDERLRRTPKEAAGFEARQFARQTLQRRGPDDPQPMPVALDLHRYPGFEHLIEHTVDIGPQLGRREASRICHDEASSATLAPRRT